MTRIEELEKRIERLEKIVKDHERVVSPHRVVGGCIPKTNLSNSIVNILNEEVLVQEKSCETCKLYTPLGNRLCAICYPPDFHYWKSKT